MAKRAIPGEICFNRKILLVRQVFAERQRRSAIRREEFLERSVILQKTASENDTIVLRRPAISMPAIPDTKTRPATNA